MLVNIVYIFHNFAWPSLNFTAQQEDANLETENTHQERRFRKRRPGAEGQMSQGLVSF